MRVHDLKTDRFSNATGRRLQEDGSRNPSQPCVLYRLEDVEDFTENYIDYWERDYLSRRETPPSPKQLEDGANADFFLRGFDRASMRFDPAVVYCPGEHKLEYNVAWITGVARADKSTFLLSLPTRQNCIRRTDDTAMSAFAYEVGALYKLGYQPQLLSTGEVFLIQPAPGCHATLRCADCIPNYNDVKNAITAIQKIMFPEIAQCATQVAISFLGLYQATTAEEIAFHDKKIKDALEQFKNDAAKYLSSPNHFKQFQLAKPEDYSDMISSVFIGAFSDELLYSPVVAMTAEESACFLTDVNCVELPDGVGVDRDKRNPTPDVIVLTLNQKQGAISQQKQAEQITKLKASEAMQMTLPIAADEDVQLAEQTVHASTLTALSFLAETNASGERKRKREATTYVAPDDTAPFGTSSGVHSKIKS